MAQRRKESTEEPASGGQELRRIANLLSLLLVKGENETDKVMTLTAVGYSVQEIAVLLGTQPNTISVRLYRGKQEQKAQDAKLRSATRKKRTR